MILPDALKLLPLYILGVCKTTALRNDVHIDLRVFGMRQLQGLGVRKLMRHVYPRIVALHQLNENDGVEVEERVQLPPLVSASYSRLDSAGAYAAETSNRLYLWLGRGISAEWLKSVFDVDQIQDVNPVLSFTLTVLEFGT